MIETMMKNKNKTKTKTKKKNNNNNNKLGLCCLKNPNLSQSMPTYDLKIKIDRPR